MRLLHISDIHYRKRDQSDISRLIRAACEDVRGLEADSGPIDLIVFSGDLTFAGMDIGTFKEAFDETIAKIAKAAGLSADRVLLCPGNHDVWRDEALKDEEIIETGLQSRLTTRDKVNAFIRSNGSITPTTMYISRLQPYLDFIATLPRPCCIYHDAFVDAHIFQCEGLSYSFCMLNSAWRSTGAGESERKKLLIGEAAVRIALEQVRDTDIKCLVVHHPFEWLHEFDRQVVEPTVLQNFDFIFHGHVHSSFPENRVSVLGQSVISQAGCLYETQEYHNSYQIVDIQPSKGIVNIMIRSWFDLPRSAFDRSLAHTKTGSVELPFAARKTLFQTPTQRVAMLARPAVYNAANEHVSMEAGLEEEFDRVFVCPPLEDRKSEPEANEDTSSLSEKVEK